MVKTITALKLLDVVTLKQDLPDHDLQAGQVGTIVELLAPEVYEVEFSDDDGQTYAMLALHSSQLLQLKYSPTRVNPPMSNTIHQYGQGDNVAGDKIDNSLTNNFQGANLSGVIGSQFKDNASVSDQLNVTNNANTAELLQLIESMCQTATQFPEEVREDILANLKDAAIEVNKPEKERDKPKLLQKCTAMLATLTLLGTGVSGALDCSNKVMDFAERVGIEIPSGR